MELIIDYETGEVIEDIAFQINREHELFESSMKSSIEHAIRCGELLAEQKAKLKHGEWIPWVENNCELSHSMANKYMKIASNSERVPNLDTENSLRGILKLLAKNNREENNNLDTMPAPQTGPQYKLICDDFRYRVDDLFGQANIIITDPPYSREYIPLYGDLAEFAVKVLPLDTLVLVMTGQSYLPEIIQQLSRFLTYHWTVAYLTLGGQSPQIWPRKVNTFWKPVLVFTNGEYIGDWFGDVCKSEVNDKRFHEWGQSESGFLDIVEKFTKPGWTILDPFCGAGTTGVAALTLGRKFIGIDKDNTTIDKAARRLSECQK